MRVSGYPGAVEKHLIPVHEVEAGQLVSASGICVGVVRAPGGPTSGVEFTIESQDGEVLGKLRLGPKEFLVVDAEVADVRVPLSSAESEDAEEANI